MKKKEELKEAIFEFIKTKDSLSFEELSELIENWIEENDPEGLGEKIKHIYERWITTGENCITTVGETD